MIFTRNRQPFGSRSARLAAALTAAATAAALALSGPAHADATMFRGNSGLTGAYTEQLSVPMAVSWKYTANPSKNNPSAPAVVGDTAYFSNGNRMYAVDANTGAFKWRYPQDQPL